MIPLEDIDRKPLQKAEQLLTPPHYRLNLTTTHARGSQCHDYT